MYLLMFILFLLWLLIVYSILALMFLRPEIEAVLDRDPACKGKLEAIFTYPGFYAIAAWRVSNALYGSKMFFLARVVSQLARCVTGVDIHPGAEIGRGLFIDHGTGVVIGETTVIGENVTLFQGVTLGGTGKEKGKRHPTLGDNIVVGCGAKILGDIVIGDNVMIGGNAVVLRSVLSNCTAVGVPARVAKKRGKKLPGGINLDHSALPDPLQNSLEKLQHEIDDIEKEISDYREKEGKKKGN